MRASLTFALLAVLRLSLRMRPQSRPEARSLTPRPSPVQKAPRRPLWRRTLRSLHSMHRATCGPFRKGTNGFTCMPGYPKITRNRSDVRDKGGMAWTMAWVNHKDPPKGVIGFGYMLVTGSDPDNMDPFATKPPPGRQWWRPDHMLCF